MSELRYALRSLRHSPWYAATMVAVTALGVALATTVFAVVDGALFKPLPYPKSSELFGLSPAVAKAPARALGLAAASVPDVRAWRNAVPEVHFAAFYANGAKMPLAGNRLEMALVDAEFLDVLGQRQFLGGFQSAHFGAAGPVSAVLISYSAWQRIFSGDPSIVGRSYLNETAVGQPPSSTQIVGILSPDFLFPSPDANYKPDILKAMPAPSAEAFVDALRKPSYVIARVPGSLPVSEVERRLGGAARDVAKLYPPYDPKRPFLVPDDVIRVVPLRTALTAAPRDIFRVTFIAAAALLLLACVNLAGLATARRHDRQHERTLREALGAGRADLLRLDGLENGLAIGGGTVVGLLLASQCLGVVRALLPSYYVLLKTPGIDARVFGFCALTAALSVGIVTLWPSTAHSAFRSSFAAEVTSAPRRSRARGTLIAAQVAIALVLVMGGSLFTISLGRVFQEDSGIQTDHAFRFEMTTGGKPQDMATISRLVAHVRRLPGVAAAGGLDHAFLQMVVSPSAFDPPTRIDDSGIESFPVTAGFLQAVGLRALEGRLPSDDELETGAPAIVVSVRAAKRYWPGQSPVGQTLTNRGGRPFTVIGVVPDVRFRSLEVEPKGEIYWPMSAETKPLLWNLYVRTIPGADDAIAPIVRSLATDFSPYQVFNLQTPAQSYRLYLRQRRLQAWLFGSFGVAALMIVGVGILGLLAMTTARRTREIGIRMALGSSRPNLVALLLREQLLWVLIGLAAGGAASAWGARFVTASLYHVSADDTLVWSLSVAAIVLTALLGTLLPALRASRADPMVALRVD